MINWHDVTLTSETKIKKIHIQEIRDILDIIEPYLCQMEHHVVNTTEKLSNYMERDTAILTQRQFSDKGVHDSNVFSSHDEYIWNSNQLGNDAHIHIAVEINNLIDDKSSNDITVENDHNDHFNTLDYIDVLSEVKNNLHTGYDVDRQNDHNNVVQISEFPSADRYVYLVHHENDFSNYNENN